ncbi:MAG: hypothetical protein V1779_02325 [bacterium]
MQILIRSMILGILLFMLIPSTDMDAQPPGKPKERIKQIKKMKLLEVLRLSEEEADKFLVKYTSWENKIEDQKDLVDKISDDLLNALKDDASIEDIKKLSQRLLSEQEKFGMMQIDKMKAMKEILDDKNYAKYLVFEDRFFKELSEMMMRRGQGQGPGGPGEGHGQGRGRREE